MKYQGVSCLGHDASLCVVEVNQILWAAHSERYLGIKNDPFLSEQIVAEAFKYGPFDCTVYYERPLVKKLRNFVAGQYSKALSIKDIPYLYLREFGIIIDYYSKHHESHAAGGYFTSPYDNADIIVVDAIGEFRTSSIYSNMEDIYAEYCPRSLGLLYSSITARIGLKPNEDEYITMGLAPFGEPIHVEDVRSLLELNLHRGVRDFLPQARNEDLAYANPEYCVHPGDTHPNHKCYDDWFKGVREWIDQSGFNLHT